MSRLTAMIIRGDERVYASAYGPIEGKYGICIGTFDEFPSGSLRPRDLLTSKPTYDTADAATKAGETIIASVREEGVSGETSVGVAPDNPSVSTSEDK